MRLKELFSRHAVAATLITLLAGWGSVRAAEDQFSVDIERSGVLSRGAGTGFEDGSWYYYPRTGQLVQWFFNGALDRDRKKVVEVDLTVRLRSLIAGGSIEVSLNWTNTTWPERQEAPPLPDTWDTGTEQQYIEQRILFPRTDVRETTVMNTSVEIPDYCPQWVSIDIRGENISVEGEIRHDCVPKDGQVPPAGDRDFGDAPEGALAYPSSGVIGQFPTCVGVGPAAWIQHESTGKMYFGSKVDTEPDGNAGKCPAFTPDLYNQDEGMQDGDAGLTKPRAYTIKGSPGSEDVYPLIFMGLESMGNACLSVTWGATLDINVHNNSGSDAYVNVLMDWNHDGKWEKAALCQGTEVPEHVLVNFRVPNNFNGPLSTLNPPGFTAGPLPGYVWTRFTISERPVPLGWNGDGVFADGETEDYLLHVMETPSVCAWREDDPHAMHWAQLPDKQVTGIDVDLSGSSLADDFRCAQDGPITDIHFWASFKDDVLPEWGPSYLDLEVNIYANQPADTLIPWSRPGQLLWTKRVLNYDVSDITNSLEEGWFEPTSKFYEGGNHKRLVQYNICFDPNENLFQQKLGEVYWLEVKEIPQKDTRYMVGWKTTKQSLQFNDAAVWRHPTLGWLPMTYPEGHEYQGKPMDLAFVVTGGRPKDMDFGDAPDPTYPTLLVSDGACHTIVPGVYLGKGVDGEADGQPNATATGDDIRGSDDEDGVVFTTPLTPGEKAIVEVTASVRGVLNAWIDWNGDGDWDDHGEQVFDDTLLASGVNTLPFDVPADAVSGRTFARFRFSTMRGLSYNGLAPDGEVEDYQIEISQVVAPAQPPLDHLKWSQPPIEKDPVFGTPVYCGWDEPAFASKLLSYSNATWKLVADDFRCAGSMPVTSVHWWGSYQNWEGQEAPRVKPESWRIGFWSNLPADTRYPFSRPSKLLWAISIPASRVEEEVAGSDEFPQKPSDRTFQYLLKLQPQEYFWQDRFTASDTTDRIFWISITAVYTGSPGPQNPWGWKSRPESWMDGAVKAEFRRDDLRAGFSLDPTAAQPISNSLICNQLDTYDMAFELDTNPEYVKWEQAFTGIRNWAHYEDEESLANEGPGTADKWSQPPDTGATGMDVDATKDLPPTWPATIGADDFECRTTGPITGITLWASWYHDVLSSSSAENVMFTLSIRQDVPAGRSPTGYSTPGKVLWRKDFSRGQFTVEPIEGRSEGYYSPANETFERDNHLMTYQYSFKIGATDAFRQTGTEKVPVVYWLAVQARLIHAPGSVATRLGWKTSASHWNDSAVWVKAEEPYSGTSWNQLKYPRDHTLGGKPIDLAFTIQTEQPGSGTSFRRIVADDWRCGSNLPVSSVVWWGSYIGYGYLPCECPPMTEPRKPDYFLLSIWSDVPDPDLNDARNFSHPGRKLWEYRANSFDEVLVGFDKHPEATDSSRQGFEPVYRYTVRLPEQNWFRQDGQNNVLWLSVVAVYKDPTKMTYAWGWTNHPWSVWDLASLTPLAHWELDEAIGSIAADSSGNDNDGTVVGNPGWRPAGGWIGGAFDFDGRSHIRVQNPKGFNFAPNSFSVSAWIYPRETRGSWHAILEYNRDAVNGNRFGIWLDNEGRFHFRVGSNTWHSAQNLVANQWYLVTATFDAVTKTMSLYVNGVLDGTATYQKGFVTPTLSTLIIGACGSADDEFFKGLIDDVRIYKVALSADDVLMLAGAGRNDGAVTAQLSTSTADTWNWTQLLDQTGQMEDMSFLLFTEPVKAASAQEDANDTGDGIEIIINSEKK